MIKKPNQLKRDFFESERNFRLLVQGITDYAICMLDPAGNVTNWNAGAQRIKGYKAREILGKHFSIFYLPEDREAGGPARALKIARKEKHFPGRGLAPSQGWHEILCLHRNRSDLREAQAGRLCEDHPRHQRAAEVLADLHASENQFRLLVSGVTDYALYMLTPAGIVVNWNAGGQRIKGYAPEEIIGQSFSRFYTPADQAAGKPARALKIAEETGHYEEEGWRVRKDGSFFWASVVIDPIRDAGRTARWLCEDHPRYLGAS